MSLNELPAIKDGNWVLLDFFPVYDKYVLSQLRKCSPDGLFCARQVKLLGYDEFYDVARQFGIDQTLETRVLEVYKPVNLLVASVMTRLSTMYLPVERISSLKIISLS